jgi:hypothetical protein
MRRCLLPACLLIALLLATLPVAADSILHGDIEGIELCPKSICGLAVFVGEFDGHVYGLPRHGVFLAGIDHDPQLPEEANETSAITGGAWLIRVPFRTIQGAVLGGMLTSNGDNTFSVQLIMLITSPSGGVTQTFNGTLRHDVFPPTIEGTIE